MLDVLRSTTTAPGEPCVTTVLTTEMQTSPAICSDMGDANLFYVQLSYETEGLRKFKGHSHVHCRPKSGNVSETVQVDVRTSTMSTCTRRVLRANVDVVHVRTSSMSTFARRTRLAHVIFVVDVRTWSEK